MLDLNAVRNEAVIEDTTANGPNPINSACMLMIIAAAIHLFGLTMLYSTTSSDPSGAALFHKQLVWGMVGLGAATTVFIIGYRKLAEYSSILMVISIILLAFADFFCREINGAHRWITFSLGGRSFSIQPSELAKLSIALYLSQHLARNIRYVNNLLLWRRGPLRPLMFCGGVILFIMVGKDLGVTLLCVATIWIVLFIAGMRLRWLLPPVLFGCPALFFLIKHFSPFRWGRLTSYMDPEAVQHTTGYQLWLSLLALGSGGWFGLGFLASRMKADYLPEKHNDFILAIVGEELGLVCMWILLFFYALLMFYAVRILINVKDRQGVLLGTGLTAMIVLQTLINVGVISGALPTKGMPAPFISYGGSNLIMCMVSIGLLVNIALEETVPGINHDMHVALLDRLQIFKRKSKDT